MQRVSAESESRERERESDELDADTHGRLRARCGSKAPQSGEPATALAQKNKFWVNSWYPNGPKLATK